MHAFFGLVGAPFTTPDGGRPRLPAAAVVSPPRRAASSAAAPPSLTHVDAAGAASMVDVTAKPATHRVATAAGSVRLGAAAFAAVTANTVAKGDVLAAARLAGVMGAKATPTLIPLCHPLALTRVDVELSLDPSRSAVVVRATAAAVGPTGVEMEVLTAVAVACLTVVDMTKALGQGAVVESVRLERKEGGRSGVWEREKGGRGAAGGG